MYNVTFICGVFLPLLDYRLLVFSSYHSFVETADGAMNPVTALSVAVRVLQLLEYGITTSKTLYKIYKHVSDALYGQLNDETIAISRSHLGLIEYLSILESESGQLSPDQQRLQQIVHNRSSIGNDLLDLLRNMQDTAYYQKYHVDLLGFL